MTPQNNEQTLYDVLEVSSSASREEILRAYQRAKSAYSTNSPALYSIFSKEEAGQLLKMIDEAYAVLINQERRREYDMSLRAKRTPDQLIQNPLLEVVPDTGLPSFLGNDESLAIPIASAMPFSNEIKYGIPTDSKSKNANETAPQKSGKSKFTHYDLDSEMEREIAEQTVFDGTFIAKIRNYKRVSLDQISDFTRIGKYYLIAVENNDFRSLPAAVFVRGFIQQIAKLLGLDEKKVIESYMKLYKDASGSK